VRPEVLLAASYAGFLTCGAFALEWLSAHTHRRALRYRTAGFTYDTDRDHWQCPEGEHLWPHEFDRELRLVRYRARAHVCNSCPSKPRCTDSDQGREIARPIDPWPHSEAGRFHRVIALLLVALALLILLVEVARHHARAEAVLLLGLLIAIALTGRWLLRDLRVHPANFPDPSAAQGLPVTVGAANAERQRPQWRRGRSSACSTSSNVSSLSQGDDPTQILAPRDLEAGLPARGAATGWRPDRLRIESGAHDQPRNNRIRVPHLARVQLIASPHGCWHVGHEREQSTCSLLVVAQARGLSTASATSGITPSGQRRTS